MEIKCKFEDVTWNIGKIYTCIVTSAQITKHNTEIAAIVGNHSPGKTNEDVKGIWFLNVKVEYFPCGLWKIFRNLKGYEIENCGLKELTKRDLIGLKGLTALWLPNNELKSLPPNLLKNMKSLTRVSFASNKLEFIDSRMFDHIKDQLVTLDLKNNSSIDDSYTYSFRVLGTKTIDELLETIDKKCVKPKLGRNFHKNFFKNSKQLWSSGRFSDFIIIVDSKEFKVHKNVLGIQSPVFAAMFENDMEESKSGKVIINDFSSSAVLEFLQYFYTGEIPDEANAMEVFALASKYDVKDLTREMEETISVNINSENAIEILKLGNQYDSEVLKSDAFDEVILANPELNLPDHMMNKPENIETLIEAKDQSEREIEEIRIRFIKIQEALLKL